ncbi:ATP-grasp enzyme-like protein [Nitrincola lacisaponensis]|uniref:ATP-grasp enzyme-like protein n=1 Tax=Nitrincola lacisaponensis TaxID=267850 RepID=A0A063Y655_9GAMM|nr:ATP-grasp domain-containing protein [Nitrincola lacisaponensis]KDE41154.1 ATP-grasp enzyme-like protein [Nitrincola lacisaponensis]
MKINKRLLFTGGGGAGNEAIWKFLKNKYDMYFADCDISNIDPDIPEDRKIEIPKACASDFIDRLIDISNAYGIDFVIPSVDEELILFSKNRNLFACEIYVPDEAFISQMLNKRLCAELIRISGLSAPRTEQVDEWKSLNFPMIIKPKTGRGSRGVMTISSEEELNAYRVFNPVPDEDLIVQELIIGEEYTVLISADKEKKLNCIIPVKVERKRGVTVLASIDMNGAVIDYAKKFHAKFPTSGIYNLQCILTAKGYVYPFEINPRISTTFCMSLAAGFDPFEIFTASVSSLFFPEKKFKLFRTWKNSFLPVG